MVKYTVKYTINTTILESTLQQCSLLLHSFVNELCSMMEKPVPIYSSNSMSQAPDEEIARQAERRA